MTVQTKTTVQTTKKTPSNLWNMIFAAVAVLGAVCWGLQLTQGLQVTNLGLNNMWGLYIVGFMIFTGVAAGSLLFAAVPYLFKSWLSLSPIPGLPPTWAQCPASWPPPSSSSWTSATRSGPGSSLPAAT